MPTITKSNAPGKANASAPAGRLTPRQDGDSDWQDEITLIEAAQAGDPEALSQLYIENNRKAYRLAIRMVRNHEDAEDAVQDAMFKVLTHLRSFHKQARFSTWLHRITLNEVLMKMRSQRHCRTVSLDELITEGQHEEGHSPEWKDGGKDPEEIASQRELRANLEKAMQALRPQAQAALIARLVEERSTADAAKSLRVSANVLKSRVRRARLALQEELGDFASALPC